MTLLCVPLALLVISYVDALTYPGRASVEVRTVDWVRDLGGGALVDAAENWWYTQHAPSTSAPTRMRSPLSATAAAAPTAVFTWPAPLPAIGRHAVAGEGRWTPGPLAVNAIPVMFQTFIRPDPSHPGVVVAVARFDQHLITAQLIAGTSEPEARTAPGTGQVPPVRQASLVATFNSGFKMADAQGGFYTQGRMVRPLRPGAASLVIDQPGRIQIDMWGRDVHLNPTVAAVRQNLALIVDHHRVVDGLDRNALRQWGDSGNQLQYTWRSALGVDAAGFLYYVAGDQLTLGTLARALADTGAVRGMELDIHPQMVNMFLYHHPPHRTTLADTRLMPAMSEPLDRYLTPDQRDFIALFQRTDQTQPARLPTGEPDTGRPDPAANFVSATRRWEFTALLPTGFQLGTLGKPQSGPCAVHCPETKARHAGNSWRVH
jgi:hypothetical protein